MTSKRPAFSGVTLKSNRTIFKSKMNKTFLVVLAICLVSAHAFVKRDILATEDRPGKKINGALNDLQDNIQKFLDPKVIQKNFDDLKKTIEQYLPKQDAQPAAPKA